MLTESSNPLDDGCIPAQNWFVTKILGAARGFVLDCGSGRGLWAKRLRDRGQLVISLDLSLRRLQRCKEEQNNDILVRASCTNLPFRSNCFDSVLLVEVIEHLAQESQGLALHEINRVLVPHGSLIMTTPNRRICRLVTLFFFPHNPEHLHELTYAEARTLVERYLELTLADGKVGGTKLGGILDSFIPTSLCWDLLLIGRKLQESSTDNVCQRRSYILGI